jgi:hypothetical protein
MTWKEIKIAIAMIGIRPEDDIEEIHIDFRPGRYRTEIYKEREENSISWVITNQRLNFRRR